jgi:hypothetical protein
MKHILCTPVLTSGFPLLSARDLVRCRRAVVLLVGLSFMLQYLFERTDVVERGCWDQVGGY